MMKMLPKLLLLVFGLAVLAPAFGQVAGAPPTVEMADALRADGKIWVVAGVFAIITLGVLVYLFRLEGKVTTLEKRVRGEG
ncbi:MAG: CcmD family protein [Hymenobacteraceae bacterium]|nr:CcmD family protein [Hymenobacteraceae bacterium]